MRLQAAQQRVRPPDHLLGPEIGTENGDEARGGRAVGQFAGRHRQPTLHGGLTLGILRQPIGPPQLARHVDEDGVRVGDDGSVVVEDRHLAERIEGKELGPLVGACLEVDLNRLVRHASNERNRRARCAWPERG